MRKLVLITVLSAVAGVGGYSVAYAGGMGDPSTVLKEKNAICERQRRGEGPMYPNMCLPEYPLAPVERSRDDRGN